MSVTIEELDGSGTESDPYKISNLDDLMAIPDEVEGHFEQTEDIDASETQEWRTGAGFDGIGNDAASYFEGVYDGNGHIIRGLFIDDDKRDVDMDDRYRYDSGLFRNVKATIRDVHLRDVRVKNTKTEDAVGGLVGKALDSDDTTHQIEQCSVEGEIVAGGPCGGIVGSSDIKISQCCFEGHIRSVGINHDVYGITPSGYIYEEDGNTKTVGIEDCYVDCVIKSNKSGSLLTFTTGDTVKRCFAAGRFEKNPESIDDDSDFASKNGAVKTIIEDGVDSNSIYRIENEDDDQSDDSGGFISSLLGLGGGGSAVDTSQAVTEQEATGESAIDTFEEFDFDTVWETNPDGYPTLQNTP